MLKRNIKFPLIMSDGVQVRTLGELKENFDIQSIIEYYLDGRLKTWLEQRFYKKEILLLEELITELNNELPQKLYEVFGVYYNESEFDFQKYMNKRNKLAKIKRFTNETEILNNLDLVAMSQEELEQIQKKHQVENTKIFLIGKEFSIKEQPCNIHYVGINKPWVTLICVDKFESKKNNISFSNVKLTAQEKVTLYPKIIDQCSIDSSIVVKNNKVHINIENLIDLPLVEIKNELSDYSEEDRKEIIREIMKRKSNNDTNIISYPVPKLFASKKETKYSFTSLFNGVKK